MYSDTRLLVGLGGWIIIVFYTKNPTRRWMRIFLWREKSLAPFSENRNSQNQDTCFLNFNELIKIRFRLKLCYEILRFWLFREEVCKQNVVSELKKKCFSLKRSKN